GLEVMGGAHGVCLHAIMRWVEFSSSPDRPPSAPSDLVCITMSCMKTEVYSWRLPPRLKSDLEEAARVERKSMAELLEQITREWLLRSHGLSQSEERQQRLRESALRTVGTLDSGRADRAENARRELRARIARRHAR